jgi:hypothetical protein
MRKVRGIASAAAALALALLGSGCTTVDLASATTKSLGVGHIFERLPVTAKIGTFRDATQARDLSPPLLARATESFAIMLRRTDVFERVVQGGGDRAEIGLDAEILSCRCTRNYGFIWTFYSVLAVIAVPANLPLTIDECEYEVALHCIDCASGQQVGTYRGRFYAYAWRGAWTLFGTFLDEPGGCFDKVNHDVIRALLDDYPKLRALAVRESGVGTDAVPPAIRPR